MEKLCKISMQRAKSSEQIHARLKKMAAAQKIFGNIKAFLTINSEKKG